MAANQHQHRLKAGCTTAESLEEKLGKEMKHRQELQQKITEYQNENRILREENAKLQEILSKAEQTIQLYKTQIENCTQKSEGFCTHENRNTSLGCEDSTTTKAHSVNMEVDEFKKEVQIASASDEDEGMEEELEYNVEVGNTDRITDPIPKPSHDTFHTTNQRMHETDEKGNTYRFVPESHKTAVQLRRQKIKLPIVSEYGSRDTRRYRSGYKGKLDDQQKKLNYLFYINKQRALPDGLKIDEIHQRWWGDYHQLEHCHSFIQWLFPIRETGMNPSAQELQLHEIQKISQDKTARARFIKSYEMMLDFYGLVLEDKITGKVKRASNWKERFENLNYSTHNHLRVTRILKCLGEFYFEHFEVHLIQHLLYEAIVEGTLMNTLNSCVNYWIEVVKTDDERRKLHQYAQELVDYVNNNC